MNKILISFNGSKATISNVSEWIGESLLTSMSAYLTSSVQQAISDSGSSIFPHTGVSLINNIGDGVWEVKTGLLVEIISCLTSRGLEFDVVKNTNRCNISEPAIGSDRKFKLYSYQEDACSKLLNAKRGYVEIPTGGGKMAVIAELASRFSSNDNILITVPSVLLLYQGRTEIANYLCIDEDEIGIVGDGNWLVRRITICIGDTLYNGIKDNNSKVTDYLKSISVWIADEVHLTLNATYFYISSLLINAEYVMGMSATPFSDDKVITALYGPKVLRIPPSELVGNVIGDPIIKFVSAPKAALSPRLSNTANYSNWLYNMAYDQVIVKNEKRNKLIVDITKKCLVEGNGPIVILVKKVGTTVNKNGKPSISHASIIKDIAKKEGLDISILHGKLPKAEQKDIVEGLENSSIKVVIASEKLLSVGISIKSLSYLILALAGSSDKDLVQRIGRMLRIYEGKKRPCIYDFIDTQSWFGSQSKNRFHTLKGIYSDVDWDET